MRKRVSLFKICISCLIIITIILIIINTIKENTQKKDQEIKSKEEKYEIEFKANQTIRVKHTKINEIIAMDINDYLRGVVPSEMPPTYNIEALKAQAVVARTYTYRKMQRGGEGGGADICDYFGHCQAFYNKDKLFEIWEKKYDKDTINKYWEKINKAVVDTQNEVILYKGELIKAFFHASSPIKTENIDQIWGCEKLPYLVSVESEESKTYGNRESIVSISTNEAIDKLKQIDSLRNIVKEDILNANICEYTTSGRVKSVKFGEFIISAEKLRVLFALKSTNFTITKKENSIEFNVIGYGHGIGLSQVGANYLASKDMTYIDIIKHYYTDVEVVKLND